MDVPLLPLSDGNQIPMVSSMWTQRQRVVNTNQHVQLALGTGTAWFKEEGDTNFDQRLVDLIKTAIGKGFYHLDCAEMYGTEEEVGRAIQESGVAREKLFITNKVSHGIGDIHAALEKSLNKLQTDYFDLYVCFPPIYLTVDPIL